jgi:hypothetical protein
MRTGAWPPMLFSLPGPPIRPAGYAWTRTVAHRRGLLAGWPVPAGSFSRHKEYRAHQATATTDKRRWTQIAAPRSGWQPTGLPASQTSLHTFTRSHSSHSAHPTPKNHRTPLVPPWNLSRIATFEFRIWTRRNAMGWTGKSRSIVSLEFRPRPARRKCPHPANFPPPKSLSHQH